MSRVVHLQPPAIISPPSAEERARAETERKRRLFDWADDLLKELGLTEQILRANTLYELRKIKFNQKSDEVEEAVCNALQSKADCFRGLGKDGLKRILRKRLEDQKKDREKKIRSGMVGTNQSVSDWTDDLKLDKDGGIRPILKNLILFLHKHPAWEGVLAFDEFGTWVVVRKPPPFGNVAPNTPWSDHHDYLTRAWFQGEDILASHADVGRAVQTAARLNTFNSVRDYLDALVWDGTPRIDTWLITYLYAEDSPYVRAIGPRWLISAVARVYQPGCKVDYTLVLEGAQGKQKSEFLRTLAISDEWFTDRLSHVSSKDAALEIQGKLIIELGELDALIKATSSAAKAFLTRRIDSFRPPYGKHTIKSPRQCVFAGTINPPVGGYLKDPTGARRIWAVVCRGMIDCEGLKRDLDQIWAETVVRYEKGHPWHLETPELEALATAEQAARFVRDPWHETVAEFIGDRKDVSIAEVMIGALHYDPNARKDWPQTAYNRVSKILTSMGFTTKSRARKGDEREWRYRREES
jgi:predicted P-loop ATPase